MVRSGGARTVDVQRAVMRSNLPAPARLLMHTLCARADYKTGVVPDEHTPSLTDLTRDTGLGRTAVARHLNALETLGWVERDRPDVVKARTEGARTGYRVAVGSSAPEELVREENQAPPSAPGELDLVREENQPSAPGEHVKEESFGLYSPPTSTTHSQPARARERAATDAPSKPPKPKPTKGTRLPADFELTDDMIAWARENTPLCNRTDHDAFVDFWRAKTGANATKHDWLGTWRNWMRREQGQRERFASRTRASPQANGQPYQGTSDRKVAQVDIALASLKARMQNGAAPHDHR